MLGSRLSALSFILLAGTSIVGGVQIKPATRVAAAWYAGWHADAADFPVSNVSWSKYTHMTYSFAETTFDVTKLDLSGSDPEALPRFVKAAHRNNVKALVSVGGWTGSRGFSIAVGSHHNRTLFVKTITDFATQYKLDGIDFDWEAPGSQGIGCNTINPNDTANFLEFLQQLRRDPIGKSLFLTAATSVNPFAGPDGNPITDVTGFAKVLDYIAIMNYDIWGPWSGTVGPNAPLNDTCAAPENQQGSAVSAVRAWSQAGMPLNQIVLGVAAYGHSFRVRKANAFTNGSTIELAEYPVFDTSDPPSGDSWDGGFGVDECGNAVTPGGGVDFWAMFELGYLNTDGTPKEDRPYRFDNCSQTAYSYDPTTEIMVSYDNTESFGVKGKYIHDHNLRGFATWEAGGDYHDMLLDSIRKNIGL